MKKFILKISGLAAIILFLHVPAFSQDKQDDEKDKVKSAKINEDDEIIIKHKSDKDGKVTVEIKGGQVYVNGKPVDEYEDDAISVYKRRGDEAVIAFGRRSPFRTDSWSYSGDGLDEFNNRAFLGVSTEKATGGGAQIKEVTKGSAAEKAGLKKGDVITKIDEIAVDNPEDLVKAIRKYKPEAKIVVSYKRDGKEQKANPVLGKNAFNTMHIENFKMPSGDFEYTIPPMGPGRAYGSPRVYSWNMNSGPRLGIKAQDTEDGKGVKVLDVDDESPAEKAGIKEGDIITQFDGKPVNSANELAELARSGKGKYAFKIKLSRDGKPQDVDVKIPRKLKTADL